MLTATPAADQLSTPQSATRSAANESSRTTAFAQVVLSEISARARTPVPADSVAVFRIGYGVLVAYSSIRFLVRGWVDTLYLEPQHHLSYRWFDWVQPLPEPLMHLHVAALAVLGVSIAAGFRYRFATGMFLIGFTYTELIDAALYLNHYWFISLTGLLLLLLPVQHHWSVDAATGRVATHTHVAAGVVWALRAQVAVVYCFAGLSKLNPDWLLHAQPLRLWLADRTHLPIVGTLLDEPVVAYLASWLGAGFDCSVVAFLLWRRTRRHAYVVLVAFHLATGVLFQIGIFPWVMIVSALVFFDPSWPRRFIPLRFLTPHNTVDRPGDPSRSRRFISSRLSTPHNTADRPAGPSWPRCFIPSPLSTQHNTADRPAGPSWPRRFIPSRLSTQHDTADRPAGPSWPRRVLPSRFPIRRHGQSQAVSVSQPAVRQHRTATKPNCGPLVLTALAVFAVIQLVLPLRHYAIDGNVRWTEEGYYFAWRVMLTEKSGHVDFRVTDPETGNTWTVDPTMVLTDWQTNHAATRPDLIHATAHLIADHFRHHGTGNIEVRADAWVSMNGRPAHRLVDPTINLAEYRRGHLPTTWILDAP